MRKRIVLWGTNEKDEKLLLALELNEKDNTVDLHTFTEAVATEEFFTKMMNEWRTKDDFVLPDEKQSIVRPLSMTDNLLPDNIKTENTNIINQAKAEWQFTVLSSKLYEYYSSELSTIKEKVDKLTNYDSNLWTEIREFWEKVQEQMKEENLFKGHGYKLKKSINEVFDSLKAVRKVMDDEFKKASAIVKKEFMSSLDIIEEKIDKGLGLQPLFNELKKMQSDFNNSKLSRSDRNKVWKRLDKAFKTVKEKKYGNKPSSGNSEMDRLNNRYNGLINAIDRMNQSLNRDKRDKEFQDKRISTTDGQLELQIRQAKTQMIEQRIISKQERLDDMLKTKIQLEEKIAKVKLKVIKQEEQKAIEEKKQKLKQKVEKELIETKESLNVNEAKLEKAAAEIKESKTKKKKPQQDKLDIKPAKKEEAKVESKEIKAPNKKSEPIEEEKTAKEETKKEDKPVVESIAKKAEDIIENVEDGVEDIVESAAKGLASIAGFVEDKLEKFVDDLQEEE